MKTPILSHLATGLMALILAVILWIFAYTENLSDAKVTYRVQFTAPQGIRIMPSDSKTVEVAVRGPRRIVENFRAQQSVQQLIKKKIEPETVADLVGDRSITVPVTREDTNGDKRLTFLNLPLSITIDVSREETKQLRLDFMPEGTPAPGYIFSRERSFVRPVTVKVTGPKSLLDKATAVYTKPIDISGLYQSFQWPVPIVASIDNQPVAVEPSTAQVYVAFDVKTATKTFPEVPVKLLVPPSYPYKLTLNRATVSVTVSGPEQALATLQATDIIVAVPVEATDRPQAEGLRYVRLPKAWLPPGLTAKIEPDNLELTVSAE